MNRDIPAPLLSQLPARRQRASRGGSALSELEAELEVVTPMLGGAARTRSIDEVDVIRPGSVRGHLRFWWRALNAHRFAGDTAELYRQEGALWGEAAGEAGGRSRVELRIDVMNPGKKDEAEIKVTDRSSYALWAARAQRRDGIPAAPRRAPGARFTIALRCPEDFCAETRMALTAWILFGGYGGRTRRGVGSLRVVADGKSWLPDATGPGDLRQALSALFKRDIFETACAAGETPLLAGAALYSGSATKVADQAWTTALGWLRDFRQEPASGARNKSKHGRPGRSNWPEADKVRRLSTPSKGLQWAHPPLHNGEPAWPRAGFGLPIIGQFQTRNRDGERWEDARPASIEPRGFEMGWASQDGVQERLASPLVVKPLALANGTFLPCALWFGRAYPDGDVVLVQGSPKTAIAGSAAPFDRLLGPGDTALFPPLGKSSLREAFLDWIATKGAQQVAP